MSTRYVNTKRYKKTIGKACIVKDCSTSAKVTTVKVNCGMRMHVALCEPHAAERSLIDAS